MESSYGRMFHPLTRKGGAPDPRTFRAHNVPKDWEKS